MKKIRRPLAFLLVAVIALTAIPLDTVTARAAPGSANTSGTTGAVSTESATDQSQSETGAESAESPDGTTAGESGAASDEESAGGEETASQKQEVESDSSKAEDPTGGTKTFSLTVAMPKIKDAKTAFSFAYELQRPKSDPESGKFALRSEESKTFKNLPEGTEYSVTLDVPKGYVCKVSKWQGKIRQDENIAPDVTKKVQTIAEDSNLSCDLGKFLDSVEIQDGSGNKLTADKLTQDGDYTVVLRFSEPEDHHIMFQKGTEEDLLAAGIADSDIPNIPQNEWTEQEKADEHVSWMYVKLGENIASKAEGISGNHDVYATKDGKILIVRFMTPDNHPMDQCEIKFTGHLTHGEESGSFDIVVGSEQGTYEPEQPAYQYIDKLAASYDPHQHTIHYKVYVFNPTDNDMAGFTYKDEYSVLSLPEARPKLKTGSLKVGETVISDAAVSDTGFSFTYTGTVPRQDKVIVEYDLDVSEQVNGLWEQTGSFEVDNTARVTPSGGTELIDPETFKVYFGTLTKTSYPHTADEFWGYDRCFSWNIVVYDPYLPLYETDIKDILPDKLDGESVVGVVINNDTSAEHKSFIKKQTAFQELQKYMTYDAASHTLTFNFKDYPKKEEVFKDDGHRFEVRIVTQYKEGKDGQGAYYNQAKVDLPSEMNTRVDDSQEYAGASGVETKKSVELSEDGKPDYTVTVDVGANILNENNAEYRIGAGVIEDMTVKYGNETGYLDTDKAIEMDSITATYGDNQEWVFKRDNTSDPEHSFSIYPVRPVGAEMGGHLRKLEDNETSVNRSSAVIFNPQEETTNEGTGWNHTRIFGKWPDALAQENVHLTLHYTIDASKAWFVKSNDTAREPFHDANTLAEYISLKNDILVYNTATAGVRDAKSSEDAVMNIVNPLEKQGALNLDPTKNQKYASYTVKFHNGENNDGAIPNTCKDIAFEDHFDSRMEYVSGSLRVERHDPDGGVEEFTYIGENPVAEENVLKAGWEEFASVNTGVTLQEDFNAQTGQYQYWFLYNLQPKAGQTPESNDPMMRIKNEAWVTYNQKELNHVSSILDFPTGVLTKQAALEDGKVTFYVEINEAGAVLSPSGNGKLTIIDTDSNNPYLSFDENSVKVQEFKDGTWQDLPAGDWTKTMENGSLKLTVPDQKHLRIWYSYSLTEDGKKQKNVQITNNVQVEGQDIIKQGDTWDFSTSDIEASASSATESLTLKKMQSDSKIPIANARFILYAANTNVTDTLMARMEAKNIGLPTITGEHGTFYPVLAYATGEDGTVKIDWEFLKRNVIYALVESRAPDGYVRHEDPIYFKVVNGKVEILTDDAKHFIAEDGTLVVNDDVNADCKARVAKEFSKESKTSPDFKFILSQVTGFNKEAYEAAGAITSDNYQTIITDTIPANGVKYTIYNTKTEAKVSEGVTDEEGAFRIQAGQYAELEISQYLFYTVQESDTPGFNLTGSGIKAGAEVTNKLADNLILLNANVAKHMSKTGDYDVKYAVSLYGINADKISDDYGLVTFGPATGKNYTNSYKACEGTSAREPGKCLHWMTWKEIIEQCKTDPTVFEPCLKNGCTHSVDLKFKDSPVKGLSFGGYMDGGDGASILYNSIADDYRKWNSWRLATGGFPASRIRAMLNGSDDKTTAEVAGDISLTADNALIGAFPKELQEGIVPKPVQSETVYNKEGKTVKTSDKLWLFSGAELFTQGDEVRPGEKNAAYSYPGEKEGFTESASSGGWWLRTLDKTYNYRSYYSNSSGAAALGIVNYNNKGIAPGFCLSGVEPESDPEPNMKYAVSIYGIMQDTTQDGNVAGLTFGPATGENYTNTSKQCESENCIHKLSWDQIIQQANTNPEVFRSCLENGCTKTVPLVLSENLKNPSFTDRMTGDGASVLINSLKPEYRKWNNTDSTTGGWPASRIRTTLNGKESCEGTNATVAGEDLLGNSDALISAFPRVLRTAILPKTVQSNNEANSGQTTYDKLWLFSGRELRVDNPAGNSGDVKLNEGAVYQRAEHFNILANTKDDKMKGCGENSSTPGWWERSLFDDQQPYHLASDGGTWRTNASDENRGLAPGFCIGEPEAYTVKIDPNEGTIEDDPEWENYHDGDNSFLRTVINGTAITLPTNEPVRDGYAFKGWVLNGDESKLYKKGEKVTINTYLAKGEKTLTFKAVWEESYTVILDPGEGSLTAPEGWTSTDGKYKKTNLRANATITLPENKPTREGYAFNNWQVNGHTENTYGANSEFTVDPGLAGEGHIITLTATYEPLYSVVLNPDGGTFTPGADWTQAGGTWKQTGLCANANINLPETKPTRDGFEFKGWQVNGHTDKIYAAGEAFTINASLADTSRVITLTAIYEALYTVVLDPNGGTLNPGTGWTNDNGKYKQTGLHANASITLPENKPVFDGYAFENWQVKGHTDKTYGAKAAFTVDPNLVSEGHTITLTAAYAALYSVVLDPNGGTLAAPGAPWTDAGSGKYKQSNLRANAGITLPVTVPTRSGFEFKGWQVTGHTETTYGTNQAFTVNPALADGSRAITLQAIWNPVYTVVLDPAGGTLNPGTGWRTGSNGKYSRAGLHANEQINLPSTAPTRTGYAFDGWQVSGKTYKPNDVFTVDANIADGSHTITLTAKWSLYTVVLNPDGGSLASPGTGWVDAGGGKWKQVNVQAGSNITLPTAVPTKSGYAFDGWKVNGTTYKANTSFRVDAGIADGSHTITLTAVWSLYTVVLNPDGGSLASPGTGWADAGGGKWKQVNLQAGSTITLPTAVPTKSGYAFDGWKVNGTTYKPNTSFKVDASLAGSSHTITLTAVWSPLYTVMLLPIGILSAESPWVNTFNDSRWVQTNLRAGTKINLPSAAPTRTGYAFDGWQVSGHTDKTYAAGEAFTVDAALANSSHTIVLIDVWSLYTVVLNPDGGTLASPGTGWTDAGGGKWKQVNVQAGSNITLPTAVPTKAGYAFDGWKVNGQIRKPNESFTVDAALADGSHTITLTAVWSLYTVVLNPDGGALASPGSPWVDAGSGKWKQVNLQAGAKITLPANAPTRTGYAFDGWRVGSQTRKAGETFNVDASLADSSHTITLTAVWSLYTVVLDPAGGTFSTGAPWAGAGSGKWKQVNLQAGAKITLPANAPTRTGYAFDGWKVNGQIHKPNESFTVDAALADGSHTITLTAVWSLYTVVLNPDGGTLASPGTGWADAGGGKWKHANSLAGSTITLPTVVPTKSGYAFDGWKVNGVTHKAGKSFTVDAALADGSHTITLTAVWSLCTVVLKTGGKGSFELPWVEKDGTYGGEWRQENLRAGSVITLPSTAPTNIYYAFDHWEVEGHTDKTYAVGESFTVDPNLADPYNPHTITLMGVWSNYTVVLDPAGGTLNPGSPWVDAGGGKWKQENIRGTSNIALPTAVPTKSGCVFDGWQVASMSRIFKAGETFTVANDLEDDSHAIICKARWRVN